MKDADSCGGFVQHQHLKEVLSSGISYDVRKAERADLRRRAESGCEAMWAEVLDIEKDARSGTVTEPEEIPCKPCRRVGFA